MAGPACRKRDRRNGEPEDILSKLAVEPILRAYVLSLVSSGFCNSLESLFKFFGKTFYAHQFGNTDRLEEIILRILKSLVEWEFIESDGGKLKATLLGQRVSQLYLDPYTASYLRTCMKRTSEKSLKDFSWLQMVSYTLEMRPLLSVRASEYDAVEKKIIEYSGNIVSMEPSMFDPEYEEFVKSIKTALFLHDWINEADEESLLEGYNVRPGEIRAKLELADWLLYSSQELARLSKHPHLIKEFEKIRIRLKHGAKEELLPLLRLEGIGRVRARKMWNCKIRAIDDIKKADLPTLAGILGKAVALSVKKQVGQNMDADDVKVPKCRRKGQLSLEKKYD